MQSNRGVVFVVDDEGLIAKTLAMILNQTGFAASAFEDPFQALETAAGGLVPDLLISDVIMPGMTGIDLAVQFRGEYPGCKVLLFSGQAATADMLATAKLHGHDFEVLAKPVHPSDLLAKLRDLTDNNQPQA
jgi:DNA-binding NtrC family response regulator